MDARFGSMLATAIALGNGDPRARRAAWRQIVDIVAQSGDALDRDARIAAFLRLETLRGDVPAADRRMTAASLAGLTGDREIILLFALDEPSVAAPMLARASLAETDWLDLIPSMPAASRNILRNRRNLAPMVESMLAHFAAGDLALPPNSWVADDTDEAARVLDASFAEPAVSQIRDLVERIEAFRQRTPDAALGPVARPRAESFAYETTLDGIVDWIDGAPREALIGSSIAVAAGPGEAGVEGGVAGAWRRRAPFRDARMTVAGYGPAGGDWLVSGAPLFNPNDGRFSGYRGTGRRPLLHETATMIATGETAADSLRQVVHELRTPLNAILGFAEMIDRQMLGPAASRYRERARAIRNEAERLVAVVDDIDQAARLDGGRLFEGRDGDFGANPSVIVAMVAATHRQALAARAVTMNLFVGEDLPTVAAARPQVERMISRLIGAVTSVAAPGERVSIRLDEELGQVILDIVRPEAIALVDERAMLDPGYTPEGDWPDAPLLGLGFSLRLVGKLAAQSGGCFLIHHDRFSLHLPVVATAVEGETG